SQELQDAFVPVLTIRGIVRECLANPSDMTEYYVALALCSLRTIMWKTMPVASRRLMYLISGLMISEFVNVRYAGTSDTDFSNPSTAIEMNTRSTDNMS
ncbi:MAG: hypothetical protein ACPG7F_17520, partial [Aggregatilineales bacterium]